MSGVDPVSTLIGGAISLGKQWLGGKGEISKAKAELAIAELKARSDTAKDRVAVELQHLTGTQSLDQIALKNQGKSLFDEAFAVAIMTPLGLVIYGTCKGTPPEMWGYNILMSLNYVPDWYLGMLFLLFVNYFGFRSLLRVVLKDYGGRLASLFRRKGKENAPGTDTPAKP